MSLSWYLSLLCKLNIAKTLYFNFKYLPFRQAVRMPFFIYRHTNLHNTSGRIVLQSAPRAGMVQIGLQGQKTQDARTLWDVEGTLIVKGSASMARGCRITISKEGTLTLGNKFCITGDSGIVCQKEITFGDSCLLSWHILIMDTDFHHIMNEEGVVINPPKPIHFGERVWVGCRCTILKGVSIADNCAIAANSTLTKSFNQPNCVIGGHGKEATVLKENIHWKQ